MARSPDSTAAAETGDPTRRAIGYAVGGLGVASVGVGAFFGLRAFSNWDEREQNCTPGCNGAAVRAADAATTSARIADITVGAGLVAIGVGAYLVLSSSSSSESDSPSSAQLDVSPIWSSPGAALRVRGGF